MLEQMCALASRAACRLFLRARGRQSAPTKLPADLVVTGIERLSRSTLARLAILSLLYT
jgi:hypothetical protein